MNGIQKVSFRSTQPVVEKKETSQPKKSSNYLATGVVAGAAAGAATAYFTPLGKEAIDSVDKFVRSDKFEESLKAVPEDKANDVDIIKVVKESIDEAEKSYTEELNRLFPEGTTEVKLSELKINDEKLSAMSYSKM
jgi:hypothetical protein